MQNNLETQTETTIDKALFINGKKMAGVRAISFTYDANNTVATATLIMHIKRGSVAITDKEIRFDTPTVRGEE